MIRSEKPKKKAPKHAKMGAAKTKHLQLTKKQKREDDDWLLIYLKKH